MLCITKEIIALKFLLVKQKHLMKKFLIYFDFLDDFDFINPQKENNFDVSNLKKENDLDVSNFQNENDLVVSNLQIEKVIKVPFSTIVTIQDGSSEDNSFEVFVSSRKKFIYDK